MKKEISVLLFEDHPKDSENETLPREIEDAASNVGGRANVFTVLTIGELSYLVRNNSFDVIVLDIMAECPDLFWDEGRKEPVSPHEAGIAILALIRMGRYGQTNKDATIYIRTARGERKIRKTVMRAGANGYFRAGADDDILVGRIVEKISS